MPADPGSRHHGTVAEAELVAPALSAQERSRLRRRRLTGVPSAVVLAALVCLLIVPLFIQSKTRRVWNEIANVVDPARALTTEIQLALALESSATQEYLQTGSVGAADEARIARARRHRAEGRLVPLAQRLGPSVTKPLTELLARVGPADVAHDSLFDGRIDRQAYASRMDEQRERFRDVIANAAQIDDAIGASADRARVDIEVTERRGAQLEFGLVVIAALATLLVARLGSRQRSMALRLDRRERSQAVLGDAARRLNASATARDVVQTLVDAAMDATNACGFAVELSCVSADDDDVDVTMRVSGDTLRRDHVPRDASVTHTLAGSASPRRVTDIGSNGDHIAPYLTARCGSCTALAIGVESERDTRATLIMLRRANDEPFGDADVAYLQALADLASAAFRRGQLLEALHDSEERFRQITENIREFIWLSDPQFSKHLYVNSAYEEIWGRSKDSLYNDPSSLLDGVHPEDRDRVWEALSGLTHGVYDIEFRVVRPDGAVRWVWSRGFPVTNERGEIYRVAGITEDITERKQIAENRVRLVRGFTHDVKNPLGAADGFLALLEDGIMGELAAKQRDSIARARQSIRRALELIANVLELARTEAGQVDINKAPMSPAEVAKDIADEFRAQATEKGLALRVETTSAPPAIESDAARVRQIVANLVSNAVKYTHENGHIQIAACATTNGDAPAPGDWAAIAVSDDGPGIPADKQRTLFTEFTRFDPNAAEGAGIGLAISQRLAAALGGMITVKSEEGVGSMITLWLPMSS